MVKMTNENKESMREDINVQTDFKGYSFEDVYDELGVHTFDESNIPLLKEAGLLGEHGLPIVTNTNYWTDEEFTGEMRWCELYQCDDRFVKSEYIRNLLAETIENAYGKPQKIVVDYNGEDDVPDTLGNFTHEQIVAILDESIIDNLYSYINGSNSDKYVLDSCSIPNKILADMRKRGWPDELLYMIAHYTQEDVQDKVNISDEEYEGLLTAFTRAYDDASDMGFVNGLCSRLNHAYEDAVDDLHGTMDTPEAGTANRVFRFDSSAIQSNIYSLWYSLEVIDDVDPDDKGFFRSWAISHINEIVDMRFKTDEIYDFDEEVFEDAVIDNYAEYVGFKNEPDEEVTEDIEVGAAGVSVEPRSGLKKPGETLIAYNPTVSRSACFLDWGRYDLLLDWAHSRYSGLFSESFCEELSEWVDDIEYYDGTKSTNILLSPAKGYGRDRFKPYEVYYVENADSSLVSAYYLETIPYEVGNAILNGKAPD